MVVDANNRFLTPGEAAPLVGLSESELGRLRSAGSGPDWLTIGRTIRYSNADLQWWLEHRPATNP